MHSYPNKQIRILFSRPLMLAVAFVCLAGCTSAPDSQWNSPGTKNAGISVTEKSTAFIHDGVTTRAEICQRLGAPAFDFKLERTLVYTLEKKKPKQWGFQVFDDSDSFGKGSEQWMFCVRYNDNGQVVRHGSIRAIPAESARDTVFRWNRGK